MKILHTVEFYSPSVGGAQEVVRQISERLANLGHNVTIATTKMSSRESCRINGVNIAEFDIQGNAVRGMSGDLDAYRHFLLNEKFDIVMFYAAQQWTFDAALQILSKIKAIKFFNPCGFSGLNLPQYEEYFKEIPAYLAMMNGLIFHSKTYQDYEFCSELGLQNMHWIPNGASETEFADPTCGFRKKYHIPHDYPMILTIGSHTGLKGHATSLKAFSQADIGRSSLVIIGNKVGDHYGCSLSCSLCALKTRFMTFGKKRVYLIDPPRADVISALFDADLFVFPSNIECSPLVLFECAAAGLPFLTSDCGNSREIVEWTQGGKLLPTKKYLNGYVAVEPIDLAKQIAKSLKDKPSTERARSQSRLIWKEKFTWVYLASEYESLYRKTFNTNNLS